MATFSYLTLDGGTLGDFTQESPEGPLTLAPHT